MIDAVDDHTSLHSSVRYLRRIAKGSAMEPASHLDVMQVDDCIDADLYAHGTELLPRIVAMLTKLSDP